MTSSLFSQYQKLGVLESVCISFFDLTGSTHLKRQLGQTRGVDLAVTHNKMAAGICSLYGGSVVKHIGDSIMVVFSIPLEGMLAALEFVGKIHSEKAPFKSKIALIHGIVTRINTGGADYLGQAVDRCARLNGEALPNQILTDQTTIEMVEPFIKDFDQMITRFLGIRHLKGIGKVPVYEVALAYPGFVNEKESVSHVHIDQPEPVKIRDPAIKAPGAGMDLPPLALSQPEIPEIVDEPLGKVIKKASLGEKELEAIAVGFRNIKHILEKSYDLNIHQVSFSGSFARGTMINPPQAIDILAVMTPPAERQAGVSDMLKQLKITLSRGSPGTEVVSALDRVNLALRETWFSVIPVLAVIENGHGRLVTPSKEGGFWITRNPAEPGQWMEQAVRRNGPVFLPFLRLLKAWQRTNCSYISSYHLELLTDLVAAETKLEISFESFFRWFRHVYTLMDQNKQPFIKEPGSPGNYADDYIYSNALTFSRFSRILTDSYNLARQGIIYHRSGDHKMAMSRWKVLFGPYIE